MKSADSRLGLVDFHTHILPKMDDGSRSVEESIQMLRAEYSFGVDTVVLTPHFYPGRDDPEHFIARRNRSSEMLREAVKAAPELSGVRLVEGAEIEYFNGLSDAADIPGLRLGDSGCMLIEMPHGVWTSRVVDDILTLSNRRDTVVILAHVERYLFKQKPDVVDALLESGVLMQSNASYFLGWLSASKALHYLKHGYIHLIGSDCHNITSRPPNLGDACKVIEKRMGEEALSEMMWGAKHILGVDVKKTEVCK